MSTILLLAPDQMSSLPAKHLCVIDCKDCSNVKLYTDKSRTEMFQAAVSMLKQEYKEDELSLEDAKKLAIRVLSKTLDMTKLTAEKGECLTYHRVLISFSVTFTTI